MSYFLSRIFSYLGYERKNHVQQRANTPPNNSGVKNTKELSNKVLVRTLTNASNQLFRDIDIYEILGHGSIDHSRFMTVPNNVIFISIIKAGNFGVQKELNPCLDKQDSLMFNHICRDKRKFLQTLFAHKDVYIYLPNDKMPVMTIEFSTNNSTFKHGVVSLPRKNAAYYEKEKIRKLRWEKTNLMKKQMKVEENGPEYQRLNQKLGKLYSSLTPTEHLQVFEPSMIKSNISKLFTKHGNSLACKTFDLNDPNLKFSINRDKPTIFYISACRGFETDRKFVQDTQRFERLMKRTRQDRLHQLINQYTQFNKLHTY